MGRSRGSKFSFPIPGKRPPQTKESAPGSSHSASASAHSSQQQQWPSHLEEPTSKAHRVLGTSDSPMFRTQSRQTSVAPSSPAYMTITASSDGSYQGSATATEYTKRPAMSKRPSSNLLGNTSGTSTRRGSDNSSSSYRLHPQASSSTMRSHYDAKSSPLSISQQTSDSAVRDMALRRGKPQVMADYPSYTDSGHEASPISPLMESEGRKNKPARLDLSKLFPIPRAGDTWNSSNALLSPAKMVKSPAAMSMNSEYYAQPMSRDPTPAPKSRAKLTKSAPRRHIEHVSHPPESPERLFKRDQYDNAKVHVRRPPKGVQHWFDALDDDSDDLPEESRAPAHIPQERRSSHMPKVPIRKASLNGLHTGNAPSHPAPRAQRSVPGFSSDSFSHEDMIDIKGLTSPSQYSLQTQNSTKTKESTMSKHNLQDSSCLSFSSSEDEHDDDRRALRKFAVRQSLIMDDDAAGEIVFGQAQAFEVRSNRSLERKMSIMSTSTNAATIDIMYTPEPFSPPNFSRVSNYSTSRRSSHLRQPSVILEDEGDRPQTARYAPPSSSAYSIRSTRTSASEPQSRSLAAQRKMMSVTPEEEALLEMMRKKRASMAKQSATNPSKYMDHEDQRQKTLDALQKTSQSSGYPAVDSPIASPIRIVEMKSKRQSSVATSSTSSTHLTPPSRGRSTKTNDEANTTSTFRDSSASDEGFTFPVARASLPHHLPPPSVFSPLDPFPPMSPYHSESIASPTTIDHVSPLPSPITPGLRNGQGRDNVKIASSDTSADSEESQVLDHELPIHIIQAAKSLEILESSHQRRRTASSGADMDFPVPPSYGAKDLAPLSEASVSSRAPSIVEPAMPLPATVERNTMRKSAIAHAFEQRGRQGSVASNASSRSNSSSLNASTYLSGRDRSRHASRGSSVASTSRNKARNSVSDDVLAAWGSLGGTY